MFENLQVAKEIIALIGAALGILASGIPLGILLWKKIREFIKHENWDRVIEALPEFIIEAEKLKGCTGTDKKVYALTKAKVFAENNNISFDAAEIGNEIDEFVKFSKYVNVRGNNVAVPQSNGNAELSADSSTSNLQSKSKKRKSLKD